MGRELPFWVLAVVTAISTIGSCSLNIILAARLSDIIQLRALRALLFAGFSLEVIALGCLSYYCLLFLRLSVSRRIAWIDIGTGAGLNAVALTVAGIALIWLAYLQYDLPPEDIHTRGAALTLWALTIVLHAAFFIFISTRIRRIFCASMPRVQVQNFGITLSPMEELATGGRPSFCSRDTTLASSRPCTPASSRTYSIPSSSTKVASIRSKFTRNSAKSSLELPSLPAGEATALGSAFDRYDTSGITHEARNTILNLTPNVTRSGLEPIPGSRPESPEDEPTLPSSPRVLGDLRSSPLAGKSSALELFPTPPSSPPNFSRPTSRGKPAMTSPSHFRHRSISASMSDLVHPLFRPDSPSHPQILTSGTMVTASPLANQPITYKTLNRLRSATDISTKQEKQEYASGSSTPTGSGQWRVMPPPEDLVLRPRSRSHSSHAQQGRPSTSGSDQAIVTRPTRNNSIGSPGPSVVEEDELPPILPGFILSAGSRTSLVGYGKRKSVKRSSAHLE